MLGHGNHCMLMESYAHGWSGNTPSKIAVFIRFVLNLNLLFETCCRRKNLIKIATVIIQKWCLV